MNERIRRMIEEIRRRGGDVQLSERLPDEAVELFLQEILNCPDCLAASKEGNRKRGRRPGH